MPSGSVLPGLNMRSLHDDLQQLLDAPPAWWRAYLPLVRALCEMPALASVANRLNALCDQGAPAKLGLHSVVGDEAAAMTPRAPGAVCNPAASSASPSTLGRLAEINRSASSSDFGMPHPDAVAVGPSPSNLLVAVGGAACPVSFVAQSELPTGEAYEAFIARTGTVPTRDNLHDLFNGLMWLAWPQTKRRLNQLQAEQISAQGISGARGSLRDALTLFDENAVVMRAPEALVEALRVRDWKKVFGEHRELWSQAEVHVFGHALLEKLMQPRKAITAHVWVVTAVSDDEVAASLDPARLAAKDFLPLPVLGVPGWWAQNEQPEFYADAQVFRPARFRSAVSPAQVAGEFT